MEILAISSRDAPEPHWMYWDDPLYSMAMFYTALVPFKVTASAFAPASAVIAHCQ